MLNTPSFPCPSLLLTFLCNPGSSVYRAVSTDFSPVIWKHACSWIWPKLRQKRKLLSIIVVIHVSECDFCYCSIMEPAKRTALCLTPGKSPSKKKTRTQRNLEQVVIRVSVEVVWTHLISKSVMSATSYKVLKVGRPCLVFYNIIHYVLLVNVRTWPNVAPFQNSRSITVSLYNAKIFSWYTGAIWANQSTCMQLMWVCPLITLFV